MFRAAIRPEFRRNRRVANRCRLPTCLMQTTHSHYAPGANAHDRAPACAQWRGLERGGLQFATGISAETSTLIAGLSLSTSLARLWWFLALCRDEARRGDLDGQGCGGHHWRLVKKALRRLFRHKAVVGWAWWRWRCGAKVNSRLDVWIGSRRRVAVVSG